MSFANSNVGKRPFNQISGEVDSPDSKKPRTENQTGQIAGRSVDWVLPSEVMINILNRLPQRDCLAWATTSQHNHHYFVTNANPLPDAEILPDAVEVSEPDVKDITSLPKEIFGEIIAQLSSKNKISLALISKNSYKNIKELVSLYIKKYISDQCIEINKKLSNPINFADEKKALNEDLSKQTLSKLLNKNFQGLIEFDFISLISSQTDKIDLKNLNSLELKRELDWYQLIEYMIVLRSEIFNLGDEVELKESGISEVLCSALFTLNSLEISLLTTWLINFYISKSKNYQTISEEYLDECFGKFLDEIIDNHYFDFLVDFLNDVGPSLMKGLDSNRLGISNCIASLIDQANREDINGFFSVYKKDSRPTGQEILYMTILIDRYSSRFNSSQNDIELKATLKDFENEKFELLNSDNKDRLIKYLCKRQLLPLYKSRPAGFNNSEISLLKILEIANTLIAKLESNEHQQDCLSLYEEYLYEFCLLEYKDLNFIALVRDFVFPINDNDSLYCLAADFFAFHIRNDVNQRDSLQSFIDHVSDILSVEPEALQRFQNNLNN